jgi:hypothetical protein
MNARTPLPDLPLDRHKAYEFDALGESTFALRRTHEGAERRGEPDMIAMGSHGSCSVSIHISPAMLVRLANTLLTDAEKAAITFAPALAGVGAE